MIPDPALPLERRRHRRSHQGSILRHRRPMAVPRPRVTKALLHPDDALDIVVFLSHATTQPKEPLLRTFPGSVRRLGRPSLSDCFQASVAEPVGLSSPRRILASPEESDRFARRVSPIRILAPLGKTLVLDAHSPALLISLLSIKSSLLVPRFSLLTPDASPRLVRFAHSARELTASQSPATSPSQPPAAPPSQHSKRVEPRIVQTCRIRSWASTWYVCSTINIAVEVRETTFSLVIRSSGTKERAHHGIARSFPRWTRSVRLRLVSMAFHAVDPSPDDLWVNVWRM